MGKSHVCKRGNVFLCSYKITIPDGKRVYGEFDFVPNFKKTLSLLLNLIEIY
jgi:hypothetical protein